VVFGLGSMGKRRIRLIQKYDDRIKLFGIDTNPERRVACEKEYKIEVFADLADILPDHKIDCAFVCTSPLTHNSIISKCLQVGIHVFTELNLVSDGYEKNISMAKQKNLVLFLSSTFLYRDEIRKIKSTLKEANCSTNYTYHVGQYLPDWHPWENYTDFFVGQKRSNGCREIFAIELPWITNVFGDIEKVEVIKNKISGLKVDYNDNYLAILQHKSGHKGIMAVDIVSRKAVRNLEVFGENIYLQWDGSPRGMKIYDFNKKRDVEIKLYKEIDQLSHYSNFIVENAYYNEVISFFENVKHGKSPLYSFEKDAEILKIIDMIEA
jgi:predicted dehydrogenase